MHTEKVILLDEFVTELKRTLSDPSGQLRVPSILLLNQSDFSHITETIEQTVGKAPQMLDHLGAVLGPLSAGNEHRHWLSVLPSASSLNSFTAVLTHSVQTGKYHAKRSALSQLLGSFVVSRDAIGISDREKALAIAMGALYAEGAITAEQWARFLGMVTWNGGKSILKLPKSIAQHKYVPNARSLLHDVLT